MRAGRLDQRVTVQRKSVTFSQSGEPQESWSSVLTDEPASVSPVSGDERFSGEQFVARQQTEFRIRWSPVSNEITPLDRIVYPSSDAGESPEVVTSQYDVLAVHELGRNEGIRIITARQVDVLP